MATVMSEASLRLLYYCKAARSAAHGTEGCSSRKGQDADGAGEGSLRNVIRNAGGFARVGFSLGLRRRAPQVRRRTRPQPATVRRTQNLRRALRPLPRALFHSGQEGPGAQGSLPAQISFAERTARQR